jgi:hypothetical protein
MPGLSVIPSLLQRLPANFRRTLYSFFSLAGVALAACQAAGWKDLGWFSLDEALRAYALTAPAAGAVAVANVTPTDPGADDFDQDFTDAFTDDFDLSSFGPITPDDDF